MKTWQEVRIDVNQETSEAVYALLEDFGAQGVAIQDPTLVDEAREAGLGDYFPDVIRDGRVRLVCYFAEHKSEAALAELADRIRGLAEFGLNTGSVEITTSVVQEEEWATAWKDYYHTTRVGRIVIQPSWEDSAGELRADDVVIVLDPGMAFGTGTHPTTVMCLEFLQEFDLKGKILWDVGTGSGILSIAACKLGAQVHAADVDKTAVEVALENSSLNNVEFSVAQGSIEVLPGRPDIIVANIIADVILDLLPKAAEALHNQGIFIAGGIIDSRADEVESAAQELGFAVQERRQRAEWVGYCFVKEQHSA